MYKKLFVLLTSAVLVGCGTTAPVVEYKIVPKYVVLAIDPAKTQPVEVPKPPSVEKFIPEKLQTKDDEIQFLQNQRGMLADLVVDLYAALKRANDRLGSIQGAQDAKLREVERLNQEALLTSKGH